MRKTLSSLLLLFLGVGILLNNSVNAKIDFSKKEKYYEKLCSVKYSYELNKKACNQFQHWKDDGKGETQKMEASFTDKKAKKMTLDELTSLLNKNRELINEKSKLYKQKKARIARNKAKATKLTKDVNSSLKMMQLVNDENQVIDVVMGSTDLDDLMTKIDGIDSINKANLEAMASLQNTTKELEEDSKYLSKDLETLKEIKEKQEDLKLEFQRQEADLYKGGNSGGNAQYNSGLDNVDLGKINDTSKSWGLPTKHATITAGTWYYPGGGWHPGADFATPVGNAVTAPADGVLLGKAAGANGYGNHIVAAFKKGDYVYTMIFAHMSGFVDGVTSFKKGDKIGISGNTGNSTGPHVHVEVFRHNTSSLATVVNEFKKNQDYWFGLGYSGKGDSGTVQRLQPTEFFGVSVGKTY